MNVSARVLTIAVVLVVASPAGWAADGASDAARARYQKGTALYNLERFGDALAEFEAAYLLKSDPAFLFNVAQCHRRMGNNAEAVKFYRTYLRTAPNAPDRAEVEKRIAALEAAASRAPAPTTAMPGPAPAAPVAESSAPNAPEARPPEPIKATPAVVAVPEAATRPAEAPPPEGGVLRKWWFWSVVGVVVLAGVAVGVIYAGRDPACPGGYECRGTK